MHRTFQTLKIITFLVKFGVPDGRLSRDHPMSEEVQNEVPLFSETIYFENESRN